MDHRDGAEELEGFFDELRTAFPGQTPRAAERHLGAMLETAHLLADTGDPVVRPVSNAAASAPQTSELPKRRRIFMSERNYLRSRAIKIAAPMAATFVVFGAMASANALPHSLQHATATAAGWVGVDLPDDEATADVTDDTTGDVTPDAFGASTEDGATPETSDAPDQGEDQQGTADDQQGEDQQGEDQQGESSDTSDDEGTSDGEDTSGNEGSNDGSSTDTSNEGSDSSGSGSGDGGSDSSGDGSGTSGGDGGSDSSGSGSGDGGSDG